MRFKEFDIIESRVKPVGPALPSHPTKSNILEKKKRKKKKSKRAKLGRYFFPGYAYYGLGHTASDSSDSGGDMGGGDGGGMEESKSNNLQKEVDKFAQWTAKKLNLQKIPKITLSMNTKEAQQGHHTGRHVQGSGEVWVYANKRNLVDILRTVFHELVHVRQEELGMIKPNSSYPGSPIEAMADMLAGKYIKIYGKMNRNIFQ